MAIKVGADREIGWNPQLRLDRQKNYDIGNYESTPFTFEAVITMFIRTLISVSL